MNKPVSQADLLAMITALQAENQALKTKAMAKRPISFKVSEKGCLSMYGLGRFPVTLYKSQWQALLANTAKIEEALTQPGLAEKGE